MRRSLVCGKLLSVVSLAISEANTLVFRTVLIAYDLLYGRGVIRKVCSCDADFSYWPILHFLKF